MWPVVEICFLLWAVSNVVDRLDASVGQARVQNDTAFAALCKPSKNATQEEKQLATKRNLHNVSTLLWQSTYPAVPVVRWR